MLGGVVPVLDSAGADDRHIGECGAHLGDHPHGHGGDGRTGGPAPPADPFTRGVRSRSTPGSVPNWSPPRLTLGQLTLSSRAEIPLAAASRPATSTYSSAVDPPRLTITGRPRARVSGSTSARKRSRPTLARPMELSIPAGVSATRGGGVPPRGPPGMG